jgi:hypothetical protein
LKRLFPKSFLAIVFFSISCYAQTYINLYKNGPEYISDYATQTFTGLSCSTSSGGNTQNIVTNVVEYKFSRFREVGGSVYIKGRFVTIPTISATSYNLQNMNVIIVYNKFVSTFTGCSNSSVEILPFSRILDGSYKTYSGNNGTIIQAEEYPAYNLFLNIVDYKFGNISLCKNDSSLDLKEYFGFTNTTFSGFGVNSLSGIFSANSTSLNTITLTGTEEFYNGIQSKMFTVTVKDTINTPLFAITPTLCGFNSSYDLSNSVYSQYLLTPNTFIGLGNLSVSGMIQNNLLNTSLLGSGVFDYKFMHLNTITGCTTSNLNSVKILPIIDINAGKDTSFCILDAGVYTFSGFYPSNGTFTGHAIIGTTFPIDSAGEFSFEYIKDDEYGCRYSDNISLIVNPLPEIQAGTVVSICGNTKALTLKDNSVYPHYGTFLGTNIENDTLKINTISLDSTINYTIKYALISTLTGCYNETERKVYILPFPNTSGVTSYSKVCNFGDITFSISGNNISSYTWYLNSYENFPITSNRPLTKPFFEERTIAFFEIQNQYNCKSARDSVQANISLSNPYIFIDTLFQKNQGKISIKDLLSITNISFSGNNIFDSDTERIGYFKDFYFTYYNNEGCLSEGNISVGLKAQSPSSLNHKTSNIISVFPNPFSETFFISGLEILNIEVYDMLGRAVLNENWYDNKAFGKSLSKGYYQLRINFLNSSHFTTFLLIKE